MNESQTPSTPVADDAWIGRTCDLVVFNSLPLTFPDSLNQSRIAEHLQRILNHVGEACDQLDALTTYQSWRSRLHAAAQTTSALVDFLDDRGEPLDSSVLEAHTLQLVAQRQSGLLALAQLQHCEGSLNSSDLQRLHFALGLADEPEDDVLYLDVGIGDPDMPMVFNGAMIVTTEQSLKTPALDEPALLYVPGRDAGLQKFASLRDLKRQLVFTLQTGSETSLWLHVSSTERQSAMTAPIELVTRVITIQPILHGVQTQLKAFAAATLAVHAQARLFDDATTQRDTLLRLHRELAHNLSVAVDETRECAIDLIAEQQRTAELAMQLPAWLLGASLEVRREYAQKLVAFHAAAVRLEAHLAAKLPSFETFTAQCLKARIKLDLGLDIDPDQLVIDLPKSVHRDVDIDPQFGSARHYKPWKASEARVLSSLSELARKNFDASNGETRASMTLMMRVSYPPSPQLPDLQRVDGDYLLRMIPQLDIARQYRTLLRSVFRLRFPALASDAELMLKAYELEIILGGFCARQRRQLSEAGYTLLTQAARARSTAELGRAGVHMSRLIFKPGQSVSGERSSRTLHGLSVIEHRASGKVLIYLPQVPDGECVIEANSVQDARDRLISSLRRLPARVVWLASRVENIDEQAAAVSYINEAMRRGFDGFIGVSPALDLLMSEQQLHVREDVLYEQSRQVARSNHDLKGEGNQRRNALYLLFFRGVVSFIPGLGVLFSVQDGWSDGHASAKALHEGRLDEGLLLAGSTLVCVLDVLLSVIPVGAAVGAVALVARRATRLRQAAGLTRPLPSMSRRSYVIKNFAGYETNLSLLDAIPQTGRNSGTWLKDGELFIYRQGKAYRVYRRPGEQTLRLKKNATHGYEAPVRQVGGEWVYHSDVGLKGGGRSMIAEVLLVEGHGNSAFKRKQARELLDQFEFPADQQQRMELLLAEHYRKTRSLPDWAEQYRRPPAPHTAPAPIKRKEPDSPQVEPDRRPSQPVAGPSRPAASADAWQNWDKPLADLTTLDQVSFNPPIYRLDFTQNYDVIRIGQKFYEILPPGGQRRTNTVFIRNPGDHAPCRNFAELSETIRRNPYEQPLMAQYQPSTGFWKVEGPLFNRTIETYIAEARAGFTGTSNAILAQKLFEMADMSTSTMTATRLINIKATLNAWRAGELAPLARLNDPLLMLNNAYPHSEAGVRLRWNISYESSLHTFERLDFATDNPVTTQWLMRSVSESGPGGGVSGLRGLMADVLERNGYEILHNLLRSGGRDFIAFRRVGQDEIYLLYVRRAQDSTIVTPPTGAFQHPSLGDGLVIPLIDSYVGQPIAQLLEQARQQGKIIKLVGGTNIGSQASSGMQVFVIRLPDEVSLV
ncbi:dermonecrotic toxin domain-containing protein [Pseudomonas sp. Irchel 3A5]|uniref:dermonecrotic toxin domain-containing protein n=1 Tax=Pseudomonas sp. Irchel 3A5 TaxID=2008911 RepID=UPI001140609F|nr:DUF6543 domain-containing protein [Pseudomonas sp. Irchel 3A5]